MTAQKNRKVDKVKMRLTDEQVMQDNKNFASCNMLAELKFCGWYIPHRKSITNEEIRFYAWLCRSAVFLLKEQDEQKRRWLRNIADNQLANAPTETMDATSHTYYEGLWNGLQMAYEILTEET